MEVAGRTDELGPFGTKTYWINLLAGLRDHLRLESLQHNVYLVYLRALCDRGLYDPGMREILNDAEAAARRITQRFESIARILTGADDHDTALIVYNAVDVEQARLAGLDVDQLPMHQQIIDKDGRRYWTPAVDGHHRLWAMYVRGKRHQLCNFVWSNLEQFQLAPESTPLGFSWDDARYVHAIESSIHQLLNKG
jgi:hypothetical protein